MAKLSLLRTVALTVTLGGGWLATPALASDEVVPDNSRTPVLVTWSTGNAVYYPLPAGAELRYQTPGPMKLVAEVRRSLADPAGRIDPAEIEAYGDGHLILRIQATKSAAPGGSVNDGSRTVPSDADIVHFTVPAGGSTLSLRATEIGPDFWVRVQQDAPADAASLVDGPDPQVDPLLPEDAPDVEPRLDEAAELKALAEDGLDDGEFDGASDTIGGLDDAPIDAPASLPSASDHPPSDHPPSDHPGYDLVDRTRVKPSAGPVVGLGAPTRGDSATLFLGARMRMPLVEDLLDLGAGVGWYRYRVDRELEVNDPFLGSYPLPVEWRTGVVPITCDAIYQIPLDLGVVQPIAGAGLGLYIANRLDKGEHSVGATVGTQWFAGADVDAGPGDLGLTLGWNLARRKFGNTSPDGTESRETLSTFRLDTTYQFRF